MGHRPRVSEGSSVLTFTIAPDDAGKRLDVFVAENVEAWSRSGIQRLIADGDVSVNEREAKPSQKIRAGDIVDVELTVSPAATFTPENIPLDIIFEDKYLAVINKPAGMVVHPGAGISSGTLANAIAFHFDLVSTGAKFENRVGIVHRLDKDTSGLLVVAKSDEMHEKLSEQFRNRKVFKSYVALVHGATRETSGRIDRPLARERFNRTRMTVAANGRDAVTLWNVRQRFEKVTLLNVEIKTGRTHQIRVHLASINHPIVGDETYNAGRDKTTANPDIRNAIRKLGRVFLHSERLSFVHPGSAEKLEFSAEMPKELKEFLDLL